MWIAPWIGAPIPLKFIALVERREGKWKLRGWGASTLSRDSVGKTERLWLRGSLPADPAHHLLNVLQQLSWASGTRILLEGSGEILYDFFGLLHLRHGEQIFLEVKIFPTFLFNSLHIWAFGASPLESPRWGGSLPFPLTLWTPVISISPGQGEDFQISFLVSCANTNHKRRKKLYFFWCETWLLF